MQERAHHKWLNIFSGGIVGAVGLLMTIETTAIREGLKLSNSIPGMEGVNWDFYATKIDQLSKPVVDSLISYGADIGGALAIIGICEIVKGVDNHDVKVVSPIIDYSLAGIMGAVGVIAEMRELIINAPIGECADIGCGSWIDLLIFAGLLAYPFLRNRNSNLSE